MLSKAFYPTKNINFLCFLSHFSWTRSLINKGLNFSSKMVNQHLFAIIYSNRQFTKLMDFAKFIGGKGHLLYYKAFLLYFTRETIFTTQLHDLLLIKENVKLPKNFPLLSTIIIQLSSNINLMSTMKKI